MKNHLFIIVFFIITLPGNAQLKGFSFGPYVERAWSTGKMETFYQNGIGAGVGADLKLPGNLGLTGSIGILRFAGKTIGKTGTTEKVDALTATPIRVGLKYRLPLVYVKVETGAARMNDNEGGGLIISPGAGLRVLALDVQLKYESWIRNSTYSFWGLKASYNF